MAKKKKKELKGQDLMRDIEAEYMKAAIPDFNVGDTIDVGVLIREGGKERVQVFNGVCIARKGTSNRETFTVRRIVQGEGVERIFQLHSPNIQSIQVVRQGKAGRARLYYLRKRTGRSARITEEMRTSEGEAESKAK